MEGWTEGRMKGKRRKEGGTGSWKERPSMTHEGGERERKTTKKNQSRIWDILPTIKKEMLADPQRILCQLNRDTGHRDFPLSRRIDGNFFLSNYTASQPNWQRWFPDLVGLMPSCATTGFMSLSSLIRRSSGSHMEKHLPSVCRRALLPSPLPSRRRVFMLGLRGEGGKEGEMRNAIRRT